MQYQAEYEIYQVKLISASFYTSQGILFIYLLFISFLIFDLFSSDRKPIVERLTSAALQPQSDIY